MSKIGKKPIKIPDGVTIVVGADSVEVKGKNATLKVPQLYGVKVDIKDGEIILSKVDNDKQAQSNWGTLNALIQNAVSGAVSNFSKELSVVGIGFKAAVEGKTLVLNLGFSHPVKFPIPDGVKITVDKSIIKIEGPDKWLVGEAAAKIRDLRRPEPYQGKGVRYKDEIIRKKAGKKAAAAATGAK